MTSASTHTVSIYEVAAAESQSAAPAIECKNLIKRFGSRVCVDSLSFAVKSGELYALLGDNGAGKTTTINMLTTLLAPSAGTFTICGFDGVKQVEKAKASFGVVSQEVAVYSELTAYENLAFIAELYGLPKKVAQPRIETLLQEISLAKRAHDRVGDFSTGMQRRLSIAIAMVREPRVIFMDEPTVGLDPASRHQIWETLAALKKRGVTILLTTHYLEEAEFLADRIGIIRQGKMLMEGTIEQLRKELRAGRTITVVLADDMSKSECDDRIRRFLVKYPANVRYEEFRRSIVFTPPPAASITEYLENVLWWLKSEAIPFEKFATTEPSLEEIFLSVQSGAKIFNQ